MNDPATPSAVPPTPPDPAGGRALPAGRSRRFAPVASDTPRPPRLPGRLTPRTERLETDTLEDLAFLETTSANTPLRGIDAPRHPADDHTTPAVPVPGRPSFVPNPTIPFLQDVHAHSNPERLEHRVSLVTRALAATCLVAAVAVVIAASIILRAPSATPSANLLPPTTASTRPTPTPTETATALRDALAALDVALRAPTADARPETGDTPPPPSPPASNPLSSTPLAETSVHCDHARLLVHTDTLKVVLVPVTDNHRLPRTAAVINRGRGWEVDPTSLTTAEDAAWPDTAATSTTSVTTATTAATTPGPRLLRALVSRHPDGTWLLDRPGADPPRLTATTAPGSRVAEELAAALATRPGPPLAADVFIAMDETRSWHLVGWSPDKWSL